MARGNQSIDNRIHDVVMRCEKLAAGGGNFDTNFVVRRNERRPSFRDSGLAGCRQDKAIDHCMHHPGICDVVRDRIRIVCGVDDRPSRTRARRLAKHGRDDAEEKKS